MVGKSTAGINGFGRFGMHLLQYWIENYADARFDITYINDDSLTLDEVVAILRDDKYLMIDQKVEIEEDALVLHIGSTKKRIGYSNKAFEKIPWLGQVDLFLECSGKHTERSDWDTVLIAGTNRVIISATSWSADEILVYGYNHEAFKPESNRVVSYGSCTVNAYIPLAKWIDDVWGVTESDVHVIHNIPVHRRDFDTLERRSCTLEEVAPHLLDFLTPENFTVAYTLVPYTGVSIIDYRFKLKHAVNQTTVIDSIKGAVESGELSQLYSLTARDNGPEEHKFTRHSADLIESSVKVRGTNVYLSAYFDNENSVNRFFDVVNYIQEVEDSDG